MAMVPSGKVGSQPTPGPQPRASGPEEEPAQHLAAKLNGALSAGESKESASVPGADLEASTAGFPGPSPGLCRGKETGIGSHKERSWGLALEGRLLRSWSCLSIPPASGTSSQSIALSSQHQLENVHSPALQTRRHHLPTPARHQRLQAAPNRDRGALFSGATADRLSGDQ